MIPDERLGELLTRAAPHVVCAAASGTMTRSAFAGALRQGRCSHDALLTIAEGTDYGILCSSSNSKAKGGTYHAISQARRLANGKTRPRKPNWVVRYEDVPSRVNTFYFVARCALFCDRLGKCSCITTAQSYYRRALPALALV